ncbi:MAG TPA: MaoC family dehydratase N-terminal domain-containing protein [Rhabdaerophilum sp.]|nr:MaoC family dehydratase N-terminal domain-containing protein [Rhabdaerophilum sp.]
MAIDAAKLKQWIGRSDSTEEVIAPFPSNALAATLDRADPPYRAGSALPPLWHWMHFLPIHPMSAVGADGHAEKGGFLPPVSLPRRMWAGSRLTFHRPLLIGENATKKSTITKVEHKSGRSGELVFVTVRHEMSNGHGLAIDEEHDIVYREAVQPGAPASTPIPAPESSHWERLIQPDPVLLFRYSALTFNSHRIHYDQPYVTDVEGYPGLIVHGPLIATLLLDGLQRAKPDAQVTRFGFRAHAPIFDVDEFTVCGSIERDGKARLWATKAGALCMDANVTFA